MRCVIFRGRFQPFTRLHYECIRSFFQNCLSSDGTNVHQWPYLILCIIRDYETLGSEHTLLSQPTDATKLFRHLFLFNPLSILQCEREIHEGLRHYLEKELKSRKSHNEKLFLRHLKEFVLRCIFVEAVPIKFPHLLQFLGRHSESETISKRESLRILFDSVATAFAEKGTTNETNHAATKLTELLFCLSRELVSMDNLSTQWLVPIFDVEDVNDSKALQNVGQIRIGLSNEQQFLSEEYSFRPTPGLLRGEPGSPVLTNGLSPIGIFIYYAYLQWLKRQAYESVNLVVVNQDIIEVTKLIRSKGLVRPCCFDLYHDRVIRKVEKAKTRFDDGTLRTTEEYILGRPKLFFELANECLIQPLPDDLNEILKRIQVGESNKMVPELTNVRSKVFISYSHNDRDVMEKLYQHLTPYIRVEQLSAFIDTHLRLGKWRSQIDTAIASTKVAVLLVSPDFLQSDFIVNKELLPFVRAAKKGDVVICPVLVSPCAYDLPYDGIKIDDYQFANELNNPLRKIMETSRADLTRNSQRSAKRLKNMLVT